MVKNDTSFDISMFPNELVFAGLPKNEPRRLHNRLDSGPNPRGRKRKPTRDNLRKIEDFLLGGFQCRGLNWRQLAITVGIPEVSNYIIRQYI